MAVSLGATDMPLLRNWQHIVARLKAIEITASATIFAQQRAFAA
jgi:hypothetical protein